MSVTAVSALSQFSENPMPLTRKRPIDEASESNRTNNNTSADNQKQAPKRARLNEDSEENGLLLRRVPTLVQTYLESIAAEEPEVPEFPGLSTDDADSDSQSCENRRRSIDDSNNAEDPTLTRACSFHTEPEEYYNEEGLPGPIRTLKHGWPYHLERNEEDSDNEGLPGPIRTLRSHQAHSLRKPEPSVPVDDNTDQPRPLTKKNLSRLEMKRRGSESSITTTTKTVSSTNTKFGVDCLKNGILTDKMSKPPTNLAYLQEQLVRQRSTSPTPTEDDFKDFSFRIQRAVNEMTTMFDMIPLFKTYPNATMSLEHDYRAVYNKAFTGLPKNQGFNNGLSPPQPDFVQGCGLHAYGFSCEAVYDFFLFKDDTNTLVLPHTAGECKGPGKDMERARLQSAYDGAALLFERNRALKLLGPNMPDPPGHAEITTFTTDGTHLNFFAHHALPLERGIVQYHQWPLASVNLIGSYESFLEGWRMIRNNQDNAKERSIKIRDALVKLQVNEGERGVQAGGNVETGATHDDKGLQPQSATNPTAQPTPPSSVSAARLPRSLLVPVLEDGDELIDQSDDVSSKRVKR